MDSARKDPDLPLLHPAFLLGTVFGIGRMPLAPGTWASFAALPVAWVVSGHFGPVALGALAILFFPLGLWASERCARASQKEDPSAIVIDEVAAQWFVLAFAPREALFYGIGFFFFRVADILKPWPIRAFEKRFPNAFGIMADDWLAALYALAGLFLATFLIG